jgi:hypothetical protein
MRQGHMAVPCNIRQESKSCGNCGRSIEMKEGVPRRRVETVPQLSRGRPKMYFKIIAKYHHEIFFGPRTCMSIFF